ncbi:hypothetical protein F4604DRAFT_1929717 [Suillus subluteus]|nr:hypothetical protein F4604DRAFT_1929717 [Suillus subluteus]
MLSFIQIIPSTKEVSKVPSSSRSQYHISYLDFLIMIFEDVAIVVIHKAIAQGSGPSTNTALFGQSIGRYENEVYILDALIDIGAEEEAMFESLASNILQSKRHQNPASGMIDEEDSNVPVAHALHRLEPTITALTLEDIAWLRNYQPSESALSPRRRASNPEFIHIASPAVPTQDNLAFNLRHIHAKLTAPITQPFPHSTQPSLNLTPVPPVMATTTMTTLPLLRGDYLNGEEPADWMQQFQLNLPAAWTDSQKIDRFTLQCARGGPAYLWKKEQLKAITLKEEDIGVMIDDNKGQEWGHVHWARQVQRVAQGLNDTNCQYLDVVLEGVPDLLRDQLSNQYPDWGTFVAGAKEDKDLQSEIEQLKAKLADPTAQLVVVQRQPVPSAPQNNAPAPMQLPAPSPISSNPFATTGTVPRTNLFYHYQTPQMPLANRVNIAERIRIASQYMTLPHQPDTEAGRAAHAQQVKEWHNQHRPDTMPHTGRLYPLKPGTAPLGSWECFACGLVTIPSHRAQDCPHPPLIPQEARWREIVSGLVGSIMCSANTLMTPTIPVQPATPVQFIVPVSPYVAQHAFPTPYYNDYEQEYMNMMEYQGNEDGL